MTQLESQLTHVEITFGVKSQEFYNAMMRGDLEEFDAQDEYRMQFMPTGKSNTARKGGGLPGCATFSV